MDRQQKNAATDWQVWKEVKICQIGGACLEPAVTAWRCPLKVDDPIRQKQCPTLYIPTGQQPLDVCLGATGPVLVWLDPDHRRHWAPHDVLPADHAAGGYCRHREPGPCPFCQPGPSWPGGLLGRRCLPTCLSRGDRNRREYLRDASRRTPCLQFPQLAPCRHQNRAGQPDWRVQCLRGQGGSKSAIAYIPRPLYSWPPSTMSSQTRADLLSSRGSQPRGSRLRTMFGSERGRSLPMVCALVEGQSWRLAQW